MKGLEKNPGVPSPAGSRRAARVRYPHFASLKARPQHASGCAEPTTDGLVALPSTRPPRAWILVARPRQSGCAGAVPWSLRAQPPASDVRPGTSSRRELTSSRRELGFHVHELPGHRVELLAQRVDLSIRYAQLVRIGHGGGGAEGLRLPAYEGLHFEESTSEGLRCGICGVGALRLGGSDLRLGGSAEREKLIRRVGRACLGLAPPVNLGVEPCRACLEPSPLLGPKGGGGAYPTSGGRREWELLVLARRRRAAVAARGEGGGGDGGGGDGGGGDGGGGE
mmetsp:Transcript_19619/g.63690  ORF Transcript_19619/g.63690 Transcript_19619/m.63690 type:complete len:281 (-) Transcript_19619:99-941(-)